MAKGKMPPAFLKKAKKGAKPNPFAKGKETAKEERLEATPFAKAKPFGRK